MSSEILSCRDFIEALMNFLLFGLRPFQQKRSRVLVTRQSYSMEQYLRSTPCTASLISGDLKIGEK